MTTLTLTKPQVSTLIASIEAMLAVLKGQPTTAKPKASRVVPFRASRSNVSPMQNRVLQRNAKIVRFFSRKGIRLTFDQSTGRFQNVLPYNGWLAKGRQVKRGQHGCCGFFHISQTEAV